MFLKISVEVLSISQVT